MSYNLTNIIDDKLTLARDYAGIIKWFKDKIPDLTSNWDDYSFLAPDIQAINQIAYVFDLLNYIEDKKYLNTNIQDTSNITFINEVCRLFGISTDDYNSGYNILSITNKSNSNLYLYKYDNIVSSNGDVYTCLEDKILLMNVRIDIKVSKGLVISYNLSKEDFSNVGEYLLPDANINRYSIELIQNNSQILSEIDDALEISGEQGYEIIKINNGKTLIKLTPQTYRDTQNILVRYILNNVDSIREDSTFIIDKYRDKEIEVKVSNPYTGLSLQEIKNKIYTSIENPKTLYNINNFDLSTIIEGTKVEYLSYLSKSEDTFQEGTINYINKKLYMTLVKIPDNKQILIKYKFIRNNKEYKYSKIIDCNSLFIDIVLHNDNLSEIVPNTINIYVGDNVITDDGKGHLNLLTTKNSYIVNYLTNDETPLESNINTFYINYTTGLLTGTSTYKNSNLYIITYQYNDNIDDTYVTFIDSNNISINLKENIVKGSIKIQIGNIQLYDNNMGQILLYKDDKSIIEEKINRYSLITNMNNIKYNMLSKQYIDFNIIVYINNNEILSLEEDIKNAIRTKIDNMKENENIIITEITSLISKINDNIQYVILNTPKNNLPGDVNKVFRCGDISIKINKSEV